MAAHAHAPIRSASPLSCIDAGQPTTAATLPPTRHQWNPKRRSKTSLQVRGHVGVSKSAQGQHRRRHSGRRPETQPHATGRGPDLRSVRDRGPVPVVAPQYSYLCESKHPWIHPELCDAASRLAPLGHVNSHSETAENPSFNREATEHEPGADRAQVSPDRRQPVRSARARAARERTVPMGQPTTATASAYGIPTSRRPR